jgi:hypothetical protein
MFLTPLPGRQHKAKGKRHSGKKLLILKTSARQRVSLSPRQS